MLRVSPAVREFLFYLVLGGVLLALALLFPDKYGEYFVRACVFAAVLGVVYLGILARSQYLERQERQRDQQNAAA